MNFKNWKKMFKSLCESEGTSFIRNMLDAGGAVNDLNEHGETLLSCAAECGNLEIVTFLVEKCGADVTVENCVSSKPIHIAAKYCHKDIVKYFLNNGFSFGNGLISSMVEICDCYKRTALHYVAVTNIVSSAGRKELIHVLLDGCANIDAVDIFGNTPLILAAQYSHKQIAELLIDLGAKLECCNKNQWTILHYACLRGWTGIVRTILKGRSEININVKTSEGYAPVYIAVKYVHKDIVKLLFEYGADIDCLRTADSDATLLHIACARGWLKLVKSLVSNGCELNTKDPNGRTPVMLAAKCFDSRVVMYLIECGADVKGYDNDRETLLHIACQENWLEVVKTLVNKGCDVNTKDTWEETPLIKAAVFRHVSVVEFLLECGANWDFRVKGQTLLHLACRREWLEVVKSLVNKGCDLNTKNFQGQSPLIICESNTNSSVAEYLIKCGADVNSCNENGWMFLHYACRNEWLECVKSLTEKKCNVNVLTRTGSIFHNIPLQLTPLHIAVDTHNLEIIKHLLNVGAHFYVENNSGETAFSMFIRRSENLEVITLFIRKGAYFEADDYAIISNNSLLKDGILQNIELCTAVIINKYNNADLPKIYKIPVVSGMIPQIDFKIASGGIVQDIEDAVKNEIEIKGFCNILNVQPIVLCRLCVMTLVKHYNC